jgi:hypothetical protein
VGNIDGHHEKVATIHYFNKIRPFLKPGAVVMFDDVSWSRDMREAWEHLSRQFAFSHAMDLGVIGICILARPGSDAVPKCWDLQRIAEGHRVRIGDPAGWKT